MASGSLRGNTRTSRHPKPSAGAPRAASATSALRKARDELRAALERQTATAEILKVIAQLPTDVEPVFEAIVENAMRLSESAFAGLWWYDGELLHMRAHRNVPAKGMDEFRAEWPMRPNPKSIIGRAFLQRRVVNVADILTEPGYPYQALREALGFRSFIAVPLMQGDVPVGVVGAWRQAVAPYTTRHIELLTTFADQAAIAIENVRLFKELGARNRDLTESLEQQTATSAILRVIAGSPTDLQPVLDTVAENAARVCGAKDAQIFRIDGDLVRMVSSYGRLPALERFEEGLPVNRDWVTGRCVVDRRSVHVDDLTAEHVEFPRGSEFARRFGHRTTFATPLLREGIPIGAILIRRGEVRPFTDRQVKLLETFADQAVIAIENVRLFNETKEMLERQTATAEILKVISSSPTDVQPVFDAIVQSAMKLVSGYSAALTRIVDGALHLAAFTVTGEPGDAAIRSSFPMPSPQGIFGKAVRTLAPVCCDDTEAEGDPELSGLRELGRARGWRSIVAVPLVREGKAIGTVSVTRRTPKPFSAHHLNLLKTFADQAVISIENVRLFQALESRTQELSRSVRQLTALGEVGQAISSTLDLETVLKTIVSRAVQLTGLDGGEIFEYDERFEEFHLQTAENLDARIVEALRRTPMRKGEGAVGRSGITGEPTAIPEIRDPSYQSRMRELLVEAGYRALLAVPLMREGRLLGALVVNRKAPGPFPAETVELLKTFATQSALAIQNARLFREIAEKGKQLEEASKHKSQFLASMSHELRTPLNAILGFNEMILDQVYGEISPNVRSPLEEMQASGRHLLGLINNVLDLAKIEAGRMELALSDYSVHDTVESVRSTLRSIAAEKGLELLTDVPADIPLAHGDPGRMSQCLLNLAGNALKFTKAGKVEIGARLEGDRLRYRVSDTGVGIPADKIGSLFTEFKQTDATIASEYGGTGLGLSITRKFVEMHRGRIWVESEMGKGSTFMVEVPLHV